MKARDLQLAPGLGYNARWLHKPLRDSLLVSAQTQLAEVEALLLGPGGQGQQQAGDGGQAAQASVPLPLAVAKGALPGDVAAWLEAQQLLPLPAAHQLGRQPAGLKGIGQGAGTGAGMAVLPPAGRDTRGVLAREFELGLLLQSF